MKKPTEYGEIIKVLEYNVFDEPEKAIVEYKGKRYTRVIHDGPTAVNDWDSMYPPPSQYRYVVINNKKVIVEGTPHYSSLAGQWTPYGRRDAFGGL